MKTPFLTPKQAEAWRATTAAPAPAAAPDPQLDIPAPGIDRGALTLGLYGAGAVLLGLVGWALH